MAITFGLADPLFFTLKAYFLRISEQRYRFKVWDLAIDGQLVSHLLLTITFVVYTAVTGFEKTEFWEGQVASVFYLIGNHLCSLAFASGPGGPVNAILATQAIYQILINAYAFGQGISSI